MLCDYKCSHDFQVGVTHTHVLHGKVIRTNKKRNNCLQAKFYLMPNGPRAPAWEVGITHGKMFAFQNGGRKVDIFSQS